MLLVEVRLADEKISARCSVGQAIRPRGVARVCDDSPVDLGAESVGRCTARVKHFEGGCRTNSIVRPARANGIRATLRISIEMDLELT